MNRIALSALKSVTNVKRSVKGKRKNADCDNGHLTHILQIATALQCDRLGFDGQRGQRMMSGVWKETMPICVTLLVVLTKA